MSHSEKARSPFAIRFLIWLGSSLFSILLIWLLGFVLDDVGQFRDVGYQEIEDRHIPVATRDQEKDLVRQIMEISRRIETAEDRRDFLRESVSGFQRTMSQMLELQRTSLEKNIPLSSQQQKAIDEAQSSFLANQTEYQRVLEELLGLEENRRTLQAARENLAGTLEEKRREATEEFREEQEWRNLQAAFLKVLILLPVILLAAWLFLKRRSSTLAPLIYALDFAVLWKLLQVIHEHFPSRYYKYIFLITALTVVFWVIRTLIHLAVHPGRSMVQKRRRDAYARGRCPGCEYPIPEHIAPSSSGGRRGRGVLIALPPKAREDHPYTCPSCGLKLFEVCESCEKIRHSLLPNCLHCGAVADAHREPS